jgi:hypothetical protein
MWRKHQLLNVIDYFFAAIFLLAFTEKISIGTTVSRLPPTPEPSVKKRVNKKLHKTSALEWPRLAGA